jgi:hypothetical protein
MNFKKIKDSNEIIASPLSAESLKMVKVSFTFPVWKDWAVRDIMAEINDMSLEDIPHEIEESSVTVEDLVKYSKEVKGWYFYHRNHDISLEDIISNSKKNTKKNTKKK